MKCPFVKLDCHECKINERCEVYNTLMDIGFLWGEDAREFEREIHRKPTKEELERMKRAKEIFKTIKEVKE